MNPSQWCEGRFVFRRSRSCHCFLRLLFWGGQSEMREEVTAVVPLINWASGPTVPRSHHRGQPAVQQGSRKAKSGVQEGMDRSYDGNPALRSAIATPRLVRPTLISIEWTFAEKSSV